MLCSELFSQGRKMFAHTYLLILTDIYMQMRNQTSNNDTRLFSTYFWLANNNTATTTAMLTSFFPVSFPIYLWTFPGILACKQSDFYVSHLPIQSCLFINFIFLFTAAVAESYEFNAHWFAWNVFFLKKDLHDYTLYKCVHAFVVYPISIAPTSGSTPFSFVLLGNSHFTIMFLAAVFRSINDILQFFNVAAIFFHSIFFPFRNGCSHSHRIHFAGMFSPHGTHLSPWILLNFLFLLAIYKLTHSTDRSWISCVRIRYSLYSVQCVHVTFYDEF